MTDKELIEKVENRRKEQRLTIRDMGFKLGHTGSYYVKLRDGYRRITDNARKNLKEFLNGQRDDIRAPKYEKEYMNRAYKSGYNKAIKDLKEFLDTKKD
ncbi:XRE family transcriptional regulator [Staphylococcus epidermidis]|uniref:XRE family transcriptional regulator n=1 Tax=Staphylococcus epidermidis TaxID=1282 RepID=UPI00193A1C88|nr:XRE family transcriptional regulator [Staphylococcus epidermidis]